MSFLYEKKKNNKSKFMHIFISCDEIKATLLLSIKIIVIIITVKP